MSKVFESKLDNLGIPLLEQAEDVGESEKELAIAALKTSVKKAEEIRSAVLSINTSALGSNDSQDVYKKAGELVRRLNWLMNDIKDSK